jgi:predicted unusual protein kinase regulating ubiquinone biosynthesis (AarF/ABC1/UbiB family)
MAPASKSAQAPKSEETAETGGAEGSRLTGRIRRYAQVSTTVGGLAARLAGARYLGLKLDRDRHAADLRAALGGIKGPLMKVAQILSTVPDALPSEYASELGHLQADAPSMGWLFVKRRMAAELGPDWQRRFAEFEHVAARAASLGQVHKARAHDGMELACKLQYPDMKSVVDADLRQLRLAFAIYERIDPAISTGEIHAEITERLYEELDYAREALHMRLYALMLQGEGGVHVPVPVDGLSTARLLSMTWLEGEPLLAFADAHIESRNQLAHNMFRAWYVPFYRYGIIHGDPHLGNYTARPDRTLNLLDFGCIRVFEPKFVAGVIDLYWALARGEGDLAVHAYETWGFENLTREVIDVLNLWAEFVYAPLLEDKVRRIQDTEGGVYGATVAEKVHRELGRLGGVTPPREFVLMDRAAIGLGSVFTHLKAEINWHQLFHGLIEDFDAKKLARRQKAALKRTGVPEAG